MTPTRAALALVVLAVLARAAMPYVLLRYVNRTLEDLEGHTGHVDDIDVALLRGAYRIEGVTVRDVDSGASDPLLTIAAIDLSVQWKALLDGAVVGEVALIEPHLNLRARVSSETGAEDDQQLGQEADWTEALDELFPVSINRFEVHDGTIELRPLDGEPPVDLSLTHLNALATNLSTVRDPDKDRPADFEATATVLESGTWRVEGVLDPLAPSPDARVATRLAGVELRALNPILRTAASIDAEAGTLELVAEMDVADGRFEGYVKPLLRDVEIYDLGEDDEGLLGQIWEALVGVTAELLENQPKDQLATKIPLEGSLDDPETDVWETIWNVLRNAYVEAFRPVLEGLTGERGDDERADDE